MKKGKKHSHKIFCIALIIVCQVSFMVLVGMQKEEFHIDEIYSYILSNSYDTDRISADAEMWGKWIEGDCFWKFITVQDNEEFAYDKVYYNNSKDCHPPLYYWLLHTVSSFCINIFSKWLGLGINFVIYILTAIFIYFISEQIIHDKLIRFIPLIMYGVSPFAVDTSMYIRMYMLLTFWAVIFVWLHMSMFQKGINAYRLCGIFLITYLGAMTHYYFCVLVFWGALLFTIYFVKYKKVKEILSYVLCVIVGIAMMIVSYPYVISQAFGSSTNNVGNEVVRNFWNFKLWIEMSEALIKEMLLHICYPPVLSVLILMIGIVLIVLSVLLHIFKTKKVEMEIKKENSWLSALVVLVFLSITFVGGEYVYLRYVYFIIPLVYILCCSIFFDIVKKMKGIYWSSIVLCLVIVIINIVPMHSEHLYIKEASEKAILQLYSEEKLIVVVDKVGAAIPTGNLSKFQQFDGIYMDTKSNLIQDNIFGKCMEEEDEFVVYIVTDLYWVNGLDVGEVFQEISVANPEYEIRYDKLTNGCLGEFYLVKVN